jgi:hypothetical protein
MHVFFQFERILRSFNTIQQVILSREDLRYTATLFAAKAADRCTFGSSVLLSSLSLMLVDLGTLKSATGPNQ